MTANKKEQITVSTKLTGKCPTCGVSANQEFRPFCSSRCANVDLSYWFSGKYAVPAFDSADDSIVEDLPDGRTFLSQVDKEC